MVDFHTHILPGIDDGSQSIGESVTLLRMQMRQGVQSVVATPHFYADRSSPEQFLEARNGAWRQLKPYLWTGLPEIYLGAEVQYFEGISGVREINLLKVEGSDLLLLEMPFQRWTDRMITDVLELNGRLDLQIVLAHIERYLPDQPRSVWQYLCQNGVLMQSNVSFFVDWRTRRKAVSMLEKGEIHMLGSDCHNKTTRPPNWELLPEKAVAIVKNSAHYLSFQKGKTVIG